MAGRLPTPPGYGKRSASVSPSGNSALEADSAKFNRNSAEIINKRYSSSESTRSVLLNPRHPNRVTLNVGGTRFDTNYSTLTRIPGTRLSQIAEQKEAHESYDRFTGEYFFDRHSDAFLGVLEYYRTGELHVAHGQCGNVIKLELDYWQLESQDIEPCCWAQYSRFLENKETLKALDDNFTVYEDLYADKLSDSAFKKWQRRKWRELDDISISFFGKVFTGLAVFFVFLSISAYILSTHRYFRVWTAGNLTNITEALMRDANAKRKYPVYNDINSKPHHAIDIINYVCMVWFSVEFAFRFFVCPEKVQFFKSVLNIIDMIVLVPMYVETVIDIYQYIHPDRKVDVPISTLKVLVILRFLRIVRILKVMKHYRAFKVLAYTIQVSTKELVLMICFLLVGVVIFACLSYYVEPDNYDSIPIGIWWALVTMTTVGYGDYVPKELLGYILGMLCTVAGVLTIAFTVPIVVNNFTLYYSHAQSRVNVKPKRRATKLLTKMASLAMAIQPLQGRVSAKDSSLENAISRERLIGSKMSVKKS